MPKWKTLLTEIARRRQENARIKEQSDKQKEQIGTYKKILGEVEVSPSFRIGRLLTWPLRVLRGFGRGS